LEKVFLNCTASQILSRTLHPLIKQTYTSPNSTFCQAQQNKNRRQDKFKRRDGKV